MLLDRILEIAALDIFKRYIASFNAVTVKVPSVIVRTGNIPAP